MLYERGHDISGRYEDWEEKLRVFYSHTIDDDTILTVTGGYIGTPRLDVIPKSATNKSPLWDLVGFIGESALHNESKPEEKTHLLFDIQKFI